MTSDLSVPAPQPNPSTDGAEPHLTSSDRPSTIDTQHTGYAERLRRDAEADLHRKALVASNEPIEDVDPQVERLTAERDAARAEAERLNAELDALRNLDGEVWRGAETVKQLEDARLKIAELSDEIVVHKAAKEVLRAEAARVREALQAIREWAEGDYGAVKEPIRPIDVWPGLRRALDAALDGAE